MAEIKKIQPLIFFLCLVFFTCKVIKVSAASYNGIQDDTTITSYDIHDDPNITAACTDFGIGGFGGITVGVRAGLCTHFDPNTFGGYGYGGNIRIRLTRHLNMEWYTDYFRTTIENLGYRTTLRMGCSILYYYRQHPLRKHKLTPFVLSGIGMNNNTLYSYEIYSLNDQDEEWNPWFNFGYGEHYFITSQLDVTVEGMYATPLSTHDKTYLQTNGGDVKYLSIGSAPGLSKGGIFAIISLNYTFVYQP